MATQIGVITAVVGTVTATAEDGSIRTLQAGDRVYANEVISTGPAGAVEIEFADGSVMDLGRDSQAMLDTAVFDPDATGLAETDGEDVPDDVAAIQQAILEGEDPTEAGEATAAGAGAGGGNEGHDAVFVNYLNPEVTPDAGFDTVGVNSTVDDIEDEQLIDGVPTAGLVTVLLDEDDLSFRSDEEVAQAINDFLDSIQAEFLGDTGFNLSDFPNAGVGDEGQPGDDLPSPNPTFFSGTLNADFGLNGPGSISFNPVVSQPAGLTSGGEPVQIWVSADGLTLIGYIAGEGEFSPEFAIQQEGPEFSGAEIIFSAQIDPVTLNFTAGIYGPLDHADTAEEGAFEENLLINMAFTITDADGDAAQGIIQLNVDDDSPVIGEQDYPQEQGEYSDFPFQMGVVDEDDTDDGVGNTDSPGDDSSTPYITLPINFGADGPAAENPVEISAEGIVDQSGNPLTSNGVEVQFSWNSSTNTLEGTADGQPVINIHVDVYDYGAGSYTEAKIELFDNLDHPIGAEGESLGTEDNLGITLNYTATDADGDQAYGSFDLSIDDDMPVIGTPEAVSVDEEGIDGNAGDSYDADATVNGVLLMPELENGDLNSALDTDAKQAIKSFVEAGGQLVINGSSGSNDETLLNDIFGFSITNGSNTSSNVPTFSQTGAATGTDYESGPAQLNNPNGTYTWDISSLPAEATVMYSDGDDAAVVTIPVGDGQITFLAYDWYNAAPTGSQDGGWTDILDIAVSANGSPAEVSVFDNGSYVDTTSGGTSAESDNVQDTLQSQGHNVSTFTGITLADILAALPEFTTGDLAGEDTVASGSLAINWGADNNNDDASEFDRSVVFTQQDAPEGLTADGEPVSYSISEDGTMLTAFTGEAGTDSYTEVFIVTLSDAGNGSYEFTLLGNLDHPEANTEDDIDLNFGFIATDSDGDAATGSFNVKVDDDAPVVSPYDVNTMRIISDDETVAELSGNIGEGFGTSDGTGTDSKEYNQSKTLQFSAGADGGTVAWNAENSSVDDATAGISFSVNDDGSLVLTQEQNGEPVEIAVITLDANTGDYTYTQTGNVLHTEGDNENEAAFTLGFTVTDGDGDTADGYLTLLIDDDTPTVTPYEVNTMRIISDDETVAELNGNIGEGFGTSDGAGTDSKEYNQSKTLQFSAGADGGTVAWNAENSSVDDATAGISFSVNDDGSLVLTQEQNGEPVEIAVITLDENTGDYTYTQTGNVLHTEGDNENEAAFTLGFTVTDGDGDTADGYLTLLIDDDTPTVTPYDVNTMRIISDDETVAELSGNIGEGFGTSDGTGTDSKEYNQSKTLQFSAGADGGTVAWNAENSSVDDDTAGISFSVNDDGSLVLTQEQNGEPVEIAVITLDANTGDYTYTQTGNVLHTEGDNENEAAFTLGFTVTDGDGDTADGYLTLLIDDDTPTVTPYEVNTMRIISDDDSVAGLNGNPGGVGDSNQYNLNGTLQFSAGADGGTVAWSVANSSSDGGAADVTFSVDSDGSLILTQMQNGEAVQVAKAILDENTGDYSYTQTANLLHTPGGDENNANFTLGFTVTDGDGDTADGHLVLRIDDDTPTVADYNVNTMRIISDDDTVAGLNGNPGEGTNTNDGAGTDSKEYNQSKTLQFSTGADGGTVAWNVDNSSVDDATAGISFSVNGDGSLIITQMQNGIPVQVAEITLDANTGEYNYTQISNLLHTAGDNENEAAFTLGFTVTDGDGDTADGHLTLLIDDDTPVITSQQINLLTESFEDFAPDLSGNNWTVVGEGGGTIIGNNGIEWTVNGAGIEIQNGNVGGSTASDGNAHAELDAHDSNGDGGTTLTELSTVVDLPTSEAELSFDYKGRPDDLADSGIEVQFGDQVITVDMFNQTASSGGLNYSYSSGVEISFDYDFSSQWTTVTVKFSGLATGDTLLSFRGLDEQGDGDSLGAFLDNISLNALASLTVDESALADGSGEAGASTTASFDFSGFFSGAFGADGPAGTGSESYSLNLNGEDVASGLFTVDNSDTDAGDGDGFGQGVEIVLNQVDGDIVGSAGGVDYFTISVNAETGEVTLTQHENIWHADTTNPDDSQGMVLDSDLLTLVKTITDADEDSAEATLDLGGVSFNFEDDAPAIEAQQPAQPYLLTVTNEGGDAGYNNTYGFYIKGENGEPEFGQIIWANVKNNTSEEITVEVTDPSNIGFFIIPNGANFNNGVDGFENGAEVEFREVDGQLQAFIGDEPLTGQNVNLRLDENAAEDNNAAGNQNWEDIPQGVSGSDEDYNDVNINVSISQLGAITVDETDIGNGDPSNATATLDLSGSFTADFGADGEGDVYYGLSVDTNVNTGLIDTQSDEEVLLRVVDGEVQGYINDGSDQVVFTVTVNSDGEVILTQLRAVEHDDATDPDEANSPATINAGAISLGATVTDADGDSADASLDVGVLFAFEDDGPVAVDDADSVVDGVAEGNVLTAASTDGESGEDSFGADGPGSVTSVTFGNTTYEVPSEGSVDIDGDFGTLTLHADGSYEYNVNPDNVPQNTETVEGWTNTGSNMTAFNLGESFLDADGKFSDTGNGTVTSGGNTPGFGVAGTSGANTSVPEQVNQSGSKSEALAFKFTGDVTAATVQFSNLFNNENGGEAMRWHAFDAEGNRIDSGIVSDNDTSAPYAGDTTANYTSNNEGSFTISDIGAFSTLVFEGIPYSNDGSDGADDSDFFVNITSYEVFGTESNQYQDQFTYEVADADGDTDSATLTINGQSEPEQGELDAVAPVAADNTYQVDGETSGNIITDDDDNGGAESGRDYDNDTPVINLSINSVIVNGGEPIEVTADNTVIGLENGTLVINLDGSYTYTPDENADGGDEFDYTLVDPDGQVSAAATVTLLQADDQPTAGETLAFVDDEGLVPDGITGGNADDVIADVDSDSNESTFAGTLSLDFGDDGAGSVDFASMNGESATIGTETVNFSWSAADNTLTATGLRGDLFEVEVTDPATGDYTVTLLDNLLHQTLNGQDGDDTENNTTVSLEYTVSDSDGDPATGTLVIDFDDDMPAVIDNQNSVLEVPVSEVAVTNFTSLFSNDQGGANKSTTNGTGGAADVIRWGGTDGSNYTFDDNDALITSEGVEPDSEFTLGTFTHNNFVINTGDAITSVDLNLSFNVMIDGVMTEINQTITLNHNETPNDGANPNDVVSFDNASSMVEIEVGDRTYQFEILGFKDSQGNFIGTSVETVEDQSNSFELVAKLSSTDDLPTQTGTVAADFGADGPADEGSITWEGAQGAITSGEIAGEFGTLTVDANGDYSYELSRDARDEMSVDSVMADSFTYYLTDADGDSVEQTLTIDIAGIANPAEANNDTNSVVEQSAYINDTVDASVTLGGWSDDTTQVAGSEEINVDPNYIAGDEDDFTTDYYVDADAQHPAAISADVDISDFRSGDAVYVLLYKDGQYTDQIRSLSSNGNVEFNVQESGNYQLRLYADDNSYTRDWHSTGWFSGHYHYYSNGDLEATLKNIRIDAFGYESPRTLSTAVNTAALTTLAVASGNILANDVKGPDGIELKSVDGELMTSGGITVNGTYGTLVIAENGDYTYTPNAGNLPDGAMESFDYTITDLSDNSEQTATLDIDIENVDYTLDNDDNVVLAEATGETLDAQDGNDVLVGAEGNDTLIGGEGNDNLMGNDGDDTLIGGAGNDILTGGAGADIFKWESGDDGTSSEPAVDFVTDFNAGEDVLDLADLLVGESDDADDLTNYLKFESDGTDTVINVSPTSGGDTTQQIVLQGVDLTQGGTISDLQIIQNLLGGDNLDVDPS